MTRKVLAFVLGMAAVAQISQLPGLYPLTAISFAAVIVWRVCSLLWLLCALCGGLWFSWHAEHYLAQRQRIDSVADPIWVTGTVVAWPQRSAHGWRFVLQLHAPAPRLTVLAHWRDADNSPRLGDRWRVLLALRPISGLRVPGAFDRERWAALHRVHGSARVIADPGNRLLGEGRGFDSLRSEIAQRLSASMPEPAASLARALVVGDRSTMTAHHWQILAATGTAHLMAISGLHIGMVAVLGWWLSRLLFPWLSRWRPCSREGLRATAAIIPALLYAALAGFSLPTQRALTMLSTLVIAILLRRRLHNWQAWALALAISLAIDPFALLSSGLWLSFGTVAILIVAFGGRPRLGRLRTGLRSQLAIGLGLLPAIATIGLPLSTWAGPINLIAIPWVALTILPPLLLGIALLPFGATYASSCFGLAGWSLNTLWDALSRISDLTHGVWLIRPTWWVLFAALVGALTLLMPRGVLARHLGVLLLLPLFLVKPVRPQLGEAWIHVLDVGQGLAILIETREHRVLYDAGPGGPDWDAGSGVILPFLRTRGFDRLDLVVLSHADADHAGGWSGLRDGISVTEVIGSGTPTRPCLTGQTWHMDGLALRVLHPNPGLPYLGNDSSCVMLVEAGDTRLLLPGDISTAVESRLQALQVTGLIVPHHGSRSSSSFAFIEQLSPRIAVVSAGYSNRFGMPHAPVLETYAAHGVALWNTADCGYLRLRLSAHRGLTVTHRERVERRYWWQRPARCGR